jgi:hypothetical protein
VPLRVELSNGLRELIAATHVLVVEEETSRHYAGIRAALKKAGRPIPSNDLWIAALCRQHRLPLLSQDQHFDAVEGPERVGWWLKRLRSVSKWIFRYPLREKSVRRWKLCGYFRPVNAFPVNIPSVNTFVSTPLKTADDLIAGYANAWL